MNIKEELLKLELRKDFVSKVNGLITNIDSSLRSNKYTLNSVIKISKEDAMIIVARDPELFLVYALKQMNAYIQAYGATMIHDDKATGMEYYGILNTMIYNHVYGYASGTDRSVLNTILMATDTIVAFLKEYTTTYKIAFNKEEVK